MPRPKPKPKRYSLDLMPLPKGRFTAEKAREWLSTWSTWYHWLVHTGCAGQEPEKLHPADAPAHYSLTDDLRTMSEACAAACSGERVRFVRGNEALPDAPVAILTILAMELDGDVEERIALTRHACRALALEGRHHFQAWKMQEEARYARLAAHCDKLEEKLEAVTEERDRLREHREELRAGLRSEAEFVLERQDAVDAAERRWAEEAAGGH